MALLAAGVPATACDRDPAAPVERIVIATGGTGSPYEALGRAFADAVRDRWGAKVEVRTTAGSVENLDLVGAGTADVGFATVDAARSATQGDAPFHGAQPIVALAGLYEDYLHIVSRADTNIHQISDLTNLDVSIGPKGSGTDILAQRVIEAGGHDLEDFTERYLSATESADEMLAGRLHAFFVVGGLPMPAVDALARRLPIRLMSLREEVGKLQERYGEYYLGRAIPPGTYGLRDEVSTIGVPNVLVVRRQMPEPVAYALTQLLFDAKARLVAAHPEARRLGERSALATYPVPLHPGATRYYRENKPMAQPGRACRVADN
jgi:TRAP transporter TAXI family solute receptor